MDKKILVVDDESGVLTAVHRELYPWTAEQGLTLLSATSGEAAYEMVKEDPANIAVVISDLRMPGLSGNELLAKVGLSYPNIVTILLTGFSETSDMIQAIKNGVFSYILKPWTRSHLLNEVRNAFELYMQRERQSRDTEVLHDDLTWAAELQRKVLSVQFPESAHVRYSSYSKPRNKFGIGGDYFDVIEIDPDRHLVLIGDVAGHGVKAAFITFMLKTLLSYDNASVVLGADQSTSQLVEWLNRRICIELRQLPDIVVTFLACLIDFPAGTVTCANAGNPPFHIRRGDRSLPMGLPGIPLGFKPDIRYNEQQEEVRPGDILLFMSDGVTEELSRNERQGELDGIVRSVAGGSDCASELAGAVLDASGSDSFHDDVTIVSATITGE